MTRRSLVLAALLVASCGLLEPDPLPPTGQIVVFVNTNALLPSAPGEAVRPDEPQPSFDRLRVELFPPGESVPCGDCSRDFAPNRKVVGEGRASFGFVPRAGVAGYRARVRLFRTRGEAAGPRPRSTIESVVALPPVAAEGIAQVTVVLNVDDLGVPRGTLDEPIAADPGAAVPGLAGTWRADLRRGCASEPGPDEVCIPGGVFWTGDPLADADSERLVALSPFFMDASEATVAQVRAAGVADPGVNPLPNGPGTPRCNFTPTAGALDDFPVNCVGLDLAEAYCKKRGARVMSEMEFEYVAGGRSGFRYPWGGDAPGCRDAIWGRDDNTTLPPQVRPCVPTVGVGSAKRGSGERDRVAFSTGVVVDLAGNVSEWTRDVFADHGKDCWEGVGPYVDPVCTFGKATATLRTVRGGGWGDLEFALRPTARVSIDIEGGSTRIGIRCTRPDG
jgi:formylglycine-generating enzyme required for sulfatase activity